MSLLTATAHLMTVTAQGGGGSARSPVKLVCHGSVADLKTFRKFRLSYALTPLLDMLVQLLDYSVEGSSAAVLAALITVWA